MSTDAPPPRAVPSHVPHELIWDHDFAEFPDLFDEPHAEACAALHAGPDIIWAAKGAQSGTPGWLLTRYALLQEVYLNPEQFPARFNRGVSDLLGMELPLIPFESDPPDHRRYRQLLQPYFQPSAIKLLDSKVRAVCTRLIDTFAGRGGCEFISEFSSLFPSEIFLNLMGMPIEPLPQFLNWEHMFMRGSVEDKVNAVRAISDYMARYAEDRRRNPGDDIVSAIVTAEVEGRKLTEGEVLGMCVLLYMGGLDTVANSLAWHLRHIATDPALQDRLRRNPELIPAAIEELFRAYGVSNTNRTVADDMLFHGVPMRKGDIVALPTFLAGRDPREFTNPHRIDIERKPRHFAFGTGGHLCLGIHLAKREVTIVLSEFLRRFRNIRIAAGETPKLNFQIVWGVERLPLAWD